LKYSNSPLRSSDHFALDAEETEFVVVNNWHVINRHTFHPKRSYQGAVKSRKSGGSKAKAELGRRYSPQTDRGPVLSTLTAKEVIAVSQLLDILGSKYPVIQGPIGELNDPKMVAAVCEAGIPVKVVREALERGELPPHRRLWLEPRQPTIDLNSVFQCFLVVNKRLIS
jgi:hypothetical protein